MSSSIEHELLCIYKTIIIESHLHHIFSKNLNQSFHFFLLKYFLSAILQQLIRTSDSPSKETIDLLVHLINDITPGTLYQ